MALKVYCGQTRSRELMRELEALGFGECTVRGELPPRRHARGWFYDNGAFGDWQAGRPFDLVRFERDMRAISNGGIGGGARIRPIAAPDFIVLPDLVARGAESLAFSRSFLDGPMRPWAGYAAPVYLAVQDGMTESEVEEFIAGHSSSSDGRDQGGKRGRIGGVFVGGTVEWKEATGAAWAAFAHARGLRCHVGRVGGKERVQWAAAAGVDSIDSCLPLWSEENLERFKNALADAAAQGG